MTQREHVTAWWRYALAIWCWDRGEPESLGHVVGAGFVCPPQLAPVVGDIIAGRRKVNARAAAKIKTKGTVAAVAACKLGAVVDHEAGTRADAQHFAERQGVEPVEVVAASNARVRAAKIEIAAGAGIAVSTLEDVERDLRRFVQDLTRD